MDAKHNPDAETYHDWEMDTYHDRAGHLFVEGRMFDFDALHAQGKAGGEFVMVSSGAAVGIANVVRWLRDERGKRAAQMKRAIDVVPGDCIVISGVEWAVQRTYQLDILEWHQSGGRVMPRQAGLPPNVIKLELRRIEPHDTLNAFRGWHEMVACFGKCDVDDLLRGNVVMVGEESDQGLPIQSRLKVTTTYYAVIGWRRDGSDYVPPVRFDSKSEAFKYLQEFFGTEANFASYGSNKPSPTSLMGRVEMRVTSGWEPT